MIRPDAPRVNGMRNLLFGVVLGVLLAWVGHTYAASGGRTFPFTVMPPMRDQLGCKAIASTHLYARHPPGELRGEVKVDAVPGTDTLAIRIDTARNRLVLISGAAVRTGQTEGGSLPIIHNDTYALVAAYADPGDGDTYVFRLDKKTGNAVWGRVGALLTGSNVAWTHYMECR